MRLSTLRVAAALLPAALVLHEGAYLLAREPVPAVHGYLGTVIPWVAALAASLTAAAVLMPLLRPRSVPMDGGHCRRPIAMAAALAGALIGIFIVQELAEGLLLGGGVKALAGALAAAPVLAPLALVIGLLAAGAVESMERGAEVVAGLMRRAPAPEGGTRPPNLPAPRSASPAVLTHAPLAFGLARRPPPALTDPA